MCQDVALEGTFLVAGVFTLAFPQYVRMCCFRLPAVVNEKAHMGHLCDFSPPFFVWVLDVKGIILSSVEYQLAFFFVNWYF